MSQKIELNDEIMKAFRPAKIIKQTMKQFVSIDFSDDGNLLYVADCNTLNVYLTRTGQNYKKLFMKNHQIQQMTHTHNNNAVLIATKKQNLILYWSIHQNNIIKMWKAHTDTISSLLICPINDYFLTTSHDNSMRLWNINQDNTEIGKLNLETESMSAFPVSNFDPSGLVFGVGWSQQQKQKQIVRICLFAINNFQEGPFADWNKDYNQVKIMKFSNCGNLILLALSDNSIVLLDAYQGIQKYRFTNFINQSSIIQCSFTPDSQYLLSGSENGLVHSWKVNGNDIAQYKSHIQKVSCVKFSPNMCTFVSAGRNVVFWLPSKQILQK